MLDYGFINTDILIYQKMAGKCWETLFFFFTNIMILPKVSMMRAAPIIFQIMSEVLYSESRGQAGLQFRPRAIPYVV